MAENIRDSRKNIGNSGDIVSRFSVMSDEEIEKLPENTGRFIRAWKSASHEERALLETYIQTWHPELLDHKSDSHNDQKWRSIEGIEAEQAVFKDKTFYLLDIGHFSFRFVRFRNCRFLINLSDGDFSACEFENCVFYDSHAVSMAWISCKFSSCTAINSDLNGEGSRCENTELNGIRYINTEI